MKGRGREKEQGRKEWESRRERERGREGTRRGGRVREKGGGPGKITFTLFSFFTQ